jgi:N-dimethylarginine dimethylaminohydrolase
MSARIENVVPVARPTRLDRPAFLMAFPYSFATKEPNNVWMQEMTAAEREPDLSRAFAQFLELYRFLGSEGVVYLLPASAECKLQDLVFTANLGVVLEHVPDREVVVLSNFSSAPRCGETPIGVEFFRALKYDVHVAPACFEGEAELKHLRDNVYIGGYGLRSDLATYDWMEREFGMKVIRVRMRDPYLYHLDCSVFPLTEESTLVCTDLYEPQELAEIARYTNIVDVSVDHAYSGICNSVRVGGTVLNASNLHELRSGTEDYREELSKNRRLEDIAAELAMEVSYFNLSEYMKGGGLLSCMVMNLNRSSYRIPLT